MTASLNWQTGKLAGHKTVLDRNYTIGRDPAHCDILLEDDSVSRQHAALELDPQGEATIVDLRSSNGTFVNGEVVTRRELRDGDRIGFGSGTDTACTYRSASSAALPPGDEGAGVVSEGGPTAIITGALKQCPNCSRLITSGLKFCRHCAHPLMDTPAEVDEATVAGREYRACRACGTAANVGAAFCRQCGAAISKPSG